MTVYKCMCVSVGVFLYVVSSLRVCEREFCAQQQLQFNLWPLFWGVIISLTDSASSIQYISSRNIEHTADRS